jgi:hypothetical protein
VLLHRRLILIRSWRSPPTPKTEPEPYARDHEDKGDADAEPDA